MVEAVVAGPDADRIRSLLADYVAGGVGGAGVAGNAEAPVSGPSLSEGYFKII
jgi:hypothetical protein